MGLEGILLYSGRALVFAAAVCALYALGCLLLRRKPRLIRLITIGYVAALVQITVLRGGVNWQAVLGGGRAFPQLVPLKTTIGEAKLGLWPLVYHTVGNMAWFLPLGLILRKKTMACAVLSGAALSAGIEIMQYLLMTGMTDIDDVILNALGATIGWILAQCIKKNGFE